MKSSAMLTLALAACLVATVYSQAYEEGSTCQPTQGAPAFYKNPDDPDCSLFYTCYRNTVQSYRCAPGLVFNEQSMMCDFPADYSACSVASPFIVPTELTPIDQSAGCTVPCVPGLYVTYPYATDDMVDCERFYMCNNGVLYEGSCSLGGTGHFIYEWSTRSCAKSTDIWNINCLNGKKRRRRSVEELKAGRFTMF